MDEGRVSLTVWAGRIAPRTYEWCKYRVTAGVWGDRTARRKTVGHFWRLKKQPRVWLWHNLIDGDNGTEPDQQRAFFALRRSYKAGTIRVLREGGRL